MSIVEHRLHDTLVCQLVIFATVKDVSKCVFTKQENKLTTEGKREIEYHWRHTCDIVRRVQGQPSHASKTSCKQSLFNLEIVI